MILDCNSGKIDIILTKSISRFGRNTLDTLKALNELENLGIDVYFENEKMIY
ncbi:recombinase family protein [Clostridium sp. CF012]|nr:recombinase family protein [Clostridium sp. CF012]